MHVLSSRRRLFVLVSGHCWNSAVRFLIRSYGLHFLDQNNERREKKKSKQNVCVFFCCLSPSAWNWNNNLVQFIKRRWWIIIMLPLTFNIRKNHHRCQSLTVTANCHCRIEITRLWAYGRQVGGKCPFVITANSCIFIFPTEWLILCPSQMVQRRRSTIRIIARNRLYEYSQMTNDHTLSHSLRECDGTLICCCCCCCFYSTVSHGYLFIIVWFLSRNAMCSLRNAFAIFGFSGLESCYTAIIQQTSSHTLP